MSLGVSELGPRQPFITLTTFNLNPRAVIFVMVAQGLCIVEQNVTIVAISTLGTFVFIVVKKLQNIYTLSFHRLPSGHYPVTLGVIIGTGARLRSFNNDLLFDG